MHQLIIHEIKRGFWGPKHREIFNEISYDFEYLAAEASKFRYSDWHVVSFKDMTEMYGYAPGRASMNAAPDVRTTHEYDEDVDDLPF